MEAKPRNAGSSALAVGWAIFLLLSAAWTVLDIGSPVGLGIEALRGPARTFLSTAGAGAVILWPMVRLSQRALPHSAARAAADAWAVMLPTMAAMAPLELLVRWGWPTTWLAIACIAGWIWAAAAVVALATRPERSRFPRSLWMLLCLAMAAAGPALAMWARPFDPALARTLAALSSASGPLHVTELGAGVSSAWLAAAAGWALALVLWACRLRPARRSNPT